MSQHSASMGDIPAVRCPLRLSGADVGAALPPPALGEHTSDVLAKVFNVGEERLAAMAGAKVVST